MEDNKTKMVKFDRAKLARLKAAHDACEGDEFTLDGDVYVKGYAKYMIEYLESHFAARKVMCN